MALLCFVGQLAGETPPAEKPVPPCTGAKCFELFNACRPLRLVVEGLPERAAEIGLTKERIQTAAESRLRAARLYTELFFDEDWTSPRAYLYVNVNALGPAFSLDITYNKWVRDEEFDLSGRARTWHTGSLGTHGGDAGYILQGVSEHVDLFIAEYLRVNEASCGGP